MRPASRWIFLTFCLAVLLSGHWFPCWLTLPSVLTFLLAGVFCSCTPKPARPACWPGFRHG
ncbi:MAG: hypothetical protein CO094_10995 [Anaerolineae bacterium CG_4_9_14_3_um_filter_57_17]|nr:hypothetical protein [bacterium]NCT20451.1 hypothetical protein [bacterium]OIO83973.1 MAG: hypothetical protein AUK01_10855 [Anaerolineae bacterium CG2_30_57_67]PJB65079.1 MAG: hypothetical protein CO094_10995 [Anaerolineae bacterium CG_4_9_14_3_um_filter_57_17]